MFYFEMMGEWSSRRAGPHQPGYYYCNTLIGTSTALFTAERVWEETDEGVTYRKDRAAWDRKVDMKEFTWIKLRAQPLRAIL